MMCENTPLRTLILKRICHVLSISGMHDLRPLLKTKRNQDLKLDIDTATKASPALKSPMPNIKLTAMVGANERPEFIRQNASLANVWLGMGTSVRCVEVADKHHFNIVDLLLDDELISMLTVST